MRFHLRWLRVVVLGVGMAAMGGCRSADTEVSKAGQSPAEARKAESAEDSQVEAAEQKQWAEVIQGLGACPGAPGSGQGQMASQWVPPEAPATLLLDPSLMSQLRGMAATLWSHGAGVHLAPASGVVLAVEKDASWGIGGREFALERVLAGPVPLGAVPGGGWSYGFGPNSPQCGGPGVACDSAGRIRLMAVGESLVTFAWEEGRLVKIADTAGTAASLEYDAEGRLTHLLLPGSARIDYTFTPAGMLASVESPLGHPTYTYEESGRLTSIARQESTLRIRYDSDGRATAFEGPAETKSAFAYESGPLGIRTTATDSLGAKTSFLVSEQGRKVEITGPNGSVTTKTLDEKGQLASLQGPDGSTLRVSWDSAGRPTSVVLPGGVLRQFSYGTAGLETVSDGKRTVQLGYDTKGQLAKMTDESGRNWVWTRDSCGRVLNRVYPGGRLEELKYDASGRLAEVLDQTGRGQKRTFDSAGRVVALEDSAMGKWSFGYDSTGNLSSVTDPLGRQESSVWDAEGRVSETTDAAGRKTQFQYDAAGRPVKALRDGRTIYSATYDAAGSPLELFDGEVTTRLEWAPGRLLTGQRVEAGLGERYEYDQAGRRTKVVRGDTLVWQAKWDAAGRMVTESPEDGIARLFEYDELGRLVKRSGGPDPLTIQWNPGGGAVMTEASGRVTRLEADPNQAGGTRAVSVTEPNGVQRTLAYTPEGWLAMEKTAGGEEVNWVYDALGRPVNRLSNLRGKTEYTWDALGHLVSVKDGTKRVRTLVYGADGRLASMKLADLEFKYGWDRQGRLTELTDVGGNKATYSYDSQGHVIETKGFDGLTTTAQWDASGRLVGWGRGDGTKEEYVRDGSGRVTEIKVNGQAVRRLVYTAEGLVSSDSGPSHDLQYTYNANKLLDAVVDGKSFARVAFLRDDAGRLKQLFGLGTTLADYGYDEQGRLASVAGPDKLGVKYHYDEKGYVAERQYEGGVRALLQRDAAGRLVKETWTGATAATLFEVTYQYDEGGRLTGQKVQGSAFTYGYDGAGRLATAVMPDGTTRTYRYDSGGSLVRAGTEGVQRGPGQKAISGPGGTREYSAAGLLESRSEGSETLQLSYDLMGHLVGLKGRSGEIAAFEADGEGNLAGWSQGERKVKLLGWLGRPLAELEKTELRRAYVTPPDQTQPLGFTEDHKAYYYVRDQQGSVLAVLDGSGKVLNRYLYAPFGALISKEEQVANPYGYLGRFTERTTGLIHFPARWADPQVGSWLAPDPHPGDLLRPEGWNRYAFLDNDPVNREDPLGTQAFEWQAGSSSLESVCNLFQQGKIAATHAFGKALDGYQYAGAIEKGGWVHDVWVKKIPGSDRVLTIFRDLNEKSGGYYGKPNLTGNIVIPQTPAVPNAPAAVQQGNSLGQSFQNGYNAVKQGVQTYGKEISTTVAGLGGMSGTLNTSVGTLAALPGGAAIIAGGVIGAGAVGAAVGTGLNQIPAVQEGAQAAISKAAGYDKPQILVNLEKEGELKGPKMAEGEKKKLGEGLAKAASGIPEPAPTGTAAGTVPLGPTAEPKPHKPAAPKVPEVAPQPPDPGAGEGDVTPQKDTEAPDAGQPDAEPQHPDVKPDGATGIEGVTPVRISIPFRNEIDASYKEFKNIVTCSGTLNFWNVGALVPGMGGVTMPITCRASLNGVEDSFTNTGTFSGGPNGTFVIQGEHESGTFTLNGGQSVTMPGIGTFSNPNPGAFANWPK